MVREFVKSSYRTSQINLQFIFEVDKLKVQTDI